MDETFNEEKHFVWSSHAKQKFKEYSGKQIGKGSLFPNLWLAWHRQLAIDTVWRVPMQSPQAHKWHVKTCEVAVNNVKELFWVFFPTTFRPYKRMIIVQQATSVKGVACEISERLESQNQCCTSNGQKEWIFNMWNSVVWPLRSIGQKWCHTMEAPPTSLHSSRKFWWKAILWAMSQGHSHQFWSGQVCIAGKNMLQLGKCGSMHLKKIFRGYEIASVVSHCYPVFRILIGIMQEYCRILHVLPDTSMCIVTSVEFVLASWVVSKRLLFCHWWYIIKY